MRFLANALGWVFRGLAFMVGRERVIRWFVRAAQENGTPEIAEMIRGKYFQLTGDVIRLDSELSPANASRAANSATPEAK